MMTAAPPAALTTLGSLVLARLAVTAGKPPSAGEVRADVGKALGRPLPADEYTALTSLLRAEGLVEPRPRSRGGMQLTAAGRAAALEYLGADALPPGTNWAAIRTKYLLPRALDVSAADAAKFATADALAAHLVRREYDLPAGTTVRSALEALVCKLVGRPDETTLDGLYRAVLSEEIRSGERLSKSDLLKQFPCKLTGAKSAGIEDLRRAVIADWLREPSDRASDTTTPAETPAADPEHFDLSEFAGTVKRIARDVPPAGRFGNNKAFIAAVWRESQAEDGFPRMSLADFKAALADASRDGLIRLEPADLVQAMDPALVAESETVRAGAAFHFVLVEEARP